MVFRKKDNRFYVCLFSTNETRNPGGNPGIEESRNRGIQESRNPGIEESRKILIYIKNIYYFMYYVTL
jgi:hypothetical protein